MLTREREIEIEAIVVDVLSDFGIAQYPVSIGEIAALLDITLIPYSSLSTKNKRLAYAASEDAFHARSWDFAEASIAFDDTEGSYFNRSRFSGGHELGHILLEHREDTPNREREADYFSGHLLVPHPLVLKCNPEYNLSEVFGVSDACASFAFDQAQARKNEGRPWLPHEKWLIENATWKGGGLAVKA